MTEHNDKDARRDQILEAALRLFTVKGFENSSVDEIAKEAGLSKGSIYWHFENKLEILLALADRFVEEGQAITKHYAQLEELGPEALYKSHRMIWEKQKNDPTHDMLFTQLVSLSPQYPQIKERLKKYHRQWDTLTIELLERGIQKGSFKPFDTKLVAHAINALYHGACAHSEMTNELNPVDVIEYATKLFYDALILPEAREENRQGQTL